MLLIRNWTFIVVSLCIMLVCPLLISIINEFATALIHVEPNQALTLKFGAWLIKFITSGLWTISLLFVADNVPNFAGWGLETNSKERRSINIMIMAVLGFAITEGLSELYELFL